MALQLDRGRSALLLLDIQHDVVHPDGKLGPDGAEAAERFRLAAGRAKAVLDAARTAALQVIHVGTRFRVGYPAANPHMPTMGFVKQTGALVEGSPGAAFLGAFAPHAGEPTVVKRAVSAFAGSDLEVLLRAGDADTLLLAGFVTHFAVEGTARDAADRGYRVVTLSDCCASNGDARHQSSLDLLGRIGELSEATEVVRLLGGGPAEVAARSKKAPQGTLAAVQLRARPVISRDEPTRPPTLVADQAEIIRVFKTFDTDGNNFMDREEFANLCAALGGRLDASQLAAAFDGVDLDGNGVVDFNEFMRWWLQAIDA